MIADLDQSLEKWLRGSLPGDMTKNLTISFLPPDQMPNAALPAINLFLYDVRQNLESRTNDWIVERQADGKATQRRPQAQVTCFYLISAWPAGGASDSVQNEHLILGEVLKLLVATPKIPDAFLQGSLKAMDIPVAATPVSAGAQNITDFWQLFGGKPKAVLNYSVNVGVDAGKPQETFLVTQKTIKFELIEGVEQ